MWIRVRFRIDLPSNFTHRELQSLSLAYEKFLISREISLDIHQCYRGKESCRAITCEIGRSGLYPKHLVHLLETTCPIQERDIDNRDNNLE